MNPVSSPALRIDSIDVFRGLTMFLMLFVNDLNDADLGHVTNLPAWLRHMPAGQDGMTFVDVILPAFLFSAGLSIPFAFARRLQTGATHAVFRHISLRSLSLVFIGLGMVNTYRFHPTAMPISPALWELLFFVAVILVWNRWPTSGGTARGWRSAGMVVLLVLAWLYQGSDGGDATWMRTSWWGILTVIGAAYFISASAYLAWGRSLACMVAVLALLTAFNIGDRSGALPWLDPLRPYFSAGGFLGGHASIMVAGVLAGMCLFRREAGERAFTCVGQLLTLAAALTTAGILLRLPHGISKLAATPAWCLLSAAICCALYAFLHWVVDLQERTRWAAILRPVGRQPLLAYILPHIFYSLLAVLGITWLDHALNDGWLGALRSLGLALLFVGVTHLLTRRRIILQL